MAFAVVALAWLDPVVARFTTHSVGSGGDMSAEAWLQWTLFHYPPSGLGAWSTSQNFPAGLSLFQQYISFAHAFVTGPLSLWLPWPAWWNVAVLVPLVLNAVAASFVVGRITGNRLWGFLLGLLFMTQPYFRFEAAYGRGNTLWVAPFVLGAWALWRCLGHPHRWQHSLAAVGGVALTCQFYWIYGMNLALLAVAMLLAFGGRLRACCWKRNAAAAAAVVVLLAIPAAWTLAAVPQLRGDATPDRALSLQPLERTVGCSVQLERPGFGFGHPGAVGAFFHWGNADPRPAESIRVKPVPGLQVLPAAILAVLLVLLLWCWRTASPVAFWTLATAASCLLALGPVLTWGGEVLVDGSGGQVALPFRWWTSLMPVGTMWQVPYRVLPLAAACLLLLVAHLLRERRAFPALVLAMVLGSGLGIELPSASGRMLMTPAPAPPACEILRHSPPGALVSLPIRCVDKIVPLQFRHGHQETDRLGDSLDPLRGHEFLRRLFQLNLLAEGRSEGYDRFPPHEELQGPPPPSNPEAVELLARPVDPERETQDRRSLVASGLRYAVLYRSGCERLSPLRGDRTYRDLQGAAGRLFGAPIHQDPEATLYLIREDPEPTPRPSGSSRTGSPGPAR